MSQLVINEGAVFAVLSASGECTGSDALGLFARDTRYLSVYRVGLAEGDDELQVLRAAPLAPYAVRIFLANRGLSRGGRPRAAHTLGVERTLVVDGRALADETRLTNYGHEPLELEWRVEVGADFADIMVVRRCAAAPQGAIEPGGALEDGWVLSYAGQDGLRRHLVVRATAGADARWGAPGRLTLSWRFSLDAGASRRLVLWFAPHEGEGALPQPPGPLEGLVAAAIRSLEESYRVWDESVARIEVGDEALGRLLLRGRQDLRALAVDFGEGPLPVAGIPWFAAPFGRDSLWAAHFLLPFAPHLARGVLRTLARWQAQREDAWTEAQPGKILHELRFGEAARLGLIPHRPYYGTADATPLFVALAAEYALVTGDLQTFSSMEEAVRRAVEWMERYGDLDGDGFIEYRRRSWAGLDNQGWKDSWDSVWHADGRLAPPPIALVEVQAYAYRAYRSLGLLEQRRGRTGRARQLLDRAADLARRFDEAFWVADGGFYAHALDGDKQRVSAVVSNPGHALWAGIVPQPRAGMVAARLMSPALFSGYGLRTAARDQIRYNPMSYHNGSVWPHDTAIAAAGMARYGLLEQSARLVRGLLDAAPHFEGWRLPELFCGFAREDGPPVPYPTACAPQAWAAAVPFAMVAALMGLQVDGLAGQVRCESRLPRWLGEVRLEGLPVGERRLTLRLRPSEKAGSGEPDDLVPVQADLEEALSLPAGPRT